MEQAKIIDTFGTYHAARLVRGEVVAPDAGWNAEDFVVALDARVPQVKGALCTYKSGV